MIVPHIQPSECRRTLFEEDTTVIGCSMDEFEHNAIQRLHDIADSIPHQPETCKKFVISDLLDLWRMQLNGNVIPRSGQL